MTRPVRSHIPLLFVGVLLGLLDLTSAFASGEDSWSYVGPLNEARRWHSTAVLPDGRVLVVGGVGASGYGVLKSAEIFDPTTGAWAFTGELQTRREEATATLLTDGRVLVVGGAVPPAVFASAEIFDPTTGLWSPARPMKYEREGHTATLLPDGRVLVIGGSDSSRWHDTAEVYDPAADIWIEVPGHMSVLRSVHTVTVLSDGRILIAGGNNATAPALDSVDILDPRTWTWEQAGYLQFSRMGHSAALLSDGRVLIAGGAAFDAHTGTRVALSSSEIYDPRTNSWSLADNLHDARLYSPMVALNNGCALVSGGQAWPTNGQVPTAEEYCVDTGLWKPAGTLNQPRSAHTATLLHDGRVLIAGGSVGAGSTASAEVHGVANASPIADAGFDRTVEASGPSGAVATLDASGSRDADGDVLTYAWTEDSMRLAVTTDPVKATEVLLGVGAHHIRLRVSDPNGLASSDDVVITVVDTTPPVLALPRDITMDPATTQGAPVSYVASATDAVSGQVSISCTPQSGVTFPIGTTAVLCSAIDAAGNRAEDKFSVTVRDSAAVLLIDSLGIPISGATVHYYAGAWQPFGTTGPDGKARKTVPFGRYTFRMTYGGAVQDKVQDLTASTIVVFQTSNVTVQLKNSLGAPLDAGTVQYYAGTWRPLGTTSVGQVSVELLPVSYTFRMTYGGGVQDKAHSVAAGALVAFQTANVTVQLRNSLGAPLDTGTVQYFAGSWRAFGTTSLGQVSLELLPVSYTFRMTYRGGVQDKLQSVATMATVEFTTAVVQSAGNRCVAYYAAGWRPFVEELELLPSSYTFRFNDGTPDTTSLIVLGVVNYIH